MNDWLKNLNRAKSILDEYFAEIGDPVSPTKEDQFKEYAKRNEEPFEDRFYMLFDVRPTEDNRNILWVSKHIKRVLGYEYLTYEKWLSIIHPNFLRIYLEFGVAAYKLSIYHQKDLIERKTSYSISLPVKSERDGKYYLFTQRSAPYQFDANGRMVTHFNSYQRIELFDRYSPSRPLVLFDEDTQIMIQSKIREQAKNNILDLFFRFKDIAARETLEAYWILYSKYMNREKGYEKVDVNSLVKEKGWTKQKIRKDNKIILSLAGEAFRLTKFTNAISVVDFLYALFGPIDYNQNQKV